MGLKNKAAVAVTGALTAGAFVTLAGAIPAGAATYGTEQSGAGSVFGVGAHSAIVGSSTHGPNISFTRSVQGRTVEFKSGRNGCVTGTSGGSLYVENCDGGAAQKFTEVGWGPATALENQASHDYVQDNGYGRQITTVRVRPGRRGQLSFSRAQLWKWIDVNAGRGSGGGQGGGHNPPAPPKHGSYTATSQISDNPDGGNGNPSNWANDYFTRTATIKLVGTETTLSDCGATATHCYAYTGTLTDKGSFVTIPGNPGPNQSGTYAGKVEKAPAVHGTMNGGADVTFYASSDQPNAHLVAGSVDDHGVSATGDRTTTDWLEQFFAAGTTFGSGPDLTAWSWSYATTSLHPEQHWTDALNNNYGDNPTDGDILG